MTLRIWGTVGLLVWGLANVSKADLQAGAAQIDITPRDLPTIVNGGMLTRSLSVVNTPLSARALVLDDGKERLAIVVVDSCMLPRPFLDDTKELAASATQIKPDHMLISATHTHSAPSCMGALGTSPDPTYPAFLMDKLVEVIAAAEKNLEPAQVGWCQTNAAEFTALRQWLRRPDRLEVDPFGNKTVRANMHAGRVWDDVTGEAGPEDPDLSMISVQALDGRPLAVLANFSMHYFSDKDISADYFGLFCEGLKERLVPEPVADKPPFVALLSHGCSGDIWRRDYTKPVPEQDIPIADYTNGLLDLAEQALKGVSHSPTAPIDMSERRMVLNYRVPDLQRLEWAKRIVEAMGDREPKDTTEVYAREQIILHEQQSTAVVVQGLRIGEIGIATTPCETYALTGIKIKEQSPLSHTMVIELANGGDGYIPPPEQHPLGGYNTWAARSAGLEVQAEPKIAETCLQLLEQVAGHHRQRPQVASGPGVDAILKLQPAAYYRMSEYSAPEAVDISPQSQHGIYEPGVVFYLAGPESAFQSSGLVNRSAHFVGGRLRTRIPDLQQDYSISVWFWNGMPNEGRDVAGWICARSRDHVLDPHGEAVGIGGTAGNTGRLIFRQGASGDLLVGKTELQRWTWYQLTLVRHGAKVQLFLNGNLEVAGEVPAEFPQAFHSMFLGGRGDNVANWEGRLDEAAVWTRALTSAEVQSLQ